MKECFANSKLEERMLTGKERHEVIAGALQKHTGSQMSPVNPTEVLMGSLGVSSYDDESLLKFFIETSKKSKELFKS